MSRYSNQEQHSWQRTEAQSRFVPGAVVIHGKSVLDAFFFCDNHVWQVGGNWNLRNLRTSALPALHFLALDCPHERQRASGGFGYWRLLESANVL